MELLKILNDNQGVIEVIGLFVVIPLAIISDKLISNKRIKEQRKELKQVLLKEYWINLNYVSAIEKSYYNNLNEDSNLHVPHCAPRTEILNKFFHYDLFTSLNRKEKEGLAEIFSQLENLKMEFINWKNRMVNDSQLILDHKLYSALSSTMLMFIDPLMRNLIDVWLKLVIDIGHLSIKQIRELNILVKNKIKSGCWIDTAYKSSYFKGIKNIDPKFNTILCWENDWHESDKDVIEIKNIVHLFESWKDINKI
jgi:hypothetical protein